MRAVMLICVAVVVACAPPKSSPPAQGAPAVAAAEGVPPSIDPRVSDGLPLVPKPLDGPPDVVWRALPAAYDSLGIKLNVVDLKQHLIGNQGMKLRQKLGSARLSKYLDCGSAQIGPSADSYDVLMSVVTHVGMNTEGTTVMTTRVQGVARPPAFSQDYSRCMTTGAIEKQIYELVAARIAH